MSKVAFITGAGGYIGSVTAQTLAKEGVPATIIGKVTGGNDRVIVRDEERRFLEPPKTDELYKVMN